MISDLVNTTGQENTISRDTWPTNILKSYETIIVREGKDAIDAEINELQDLILYERLMLTQDQVLPGFIYANPFQGGAFNSYLVSCDGTNVYVQSGRGRWMNRRIDMPATLSSGASGNALSGLTLPAPGQQLYIFMDLFVREYLGNPSNPVVKATRTVPGNDPYLVDPTIDLETARRVQFFDPTVDIQATAIGGTVPAPATGHITFPLALLQNIAGTYVVTDLRKSAQALNVFLPGATQYVAAAVSATNTITVSTPNVFVYINGGPLAATVKNILNPAGNFALGQQLLLQPSAGYSITLVNNASGAGAMRLAYPANVTMTYGMHILFEWTGGYWLEVSRSFGDQRSQGAMPSSVISPVGTVLYPTTGNHNVLTVGDQTVNNIDQSVLGYGQLLTLTVAYGSSLTLKDAAGGAGQMYLAYGQDETLTTEANSSMAITFINNPAGWWEVSRSFGDPRLIGYTSDSVLTTNAGIVPFTSGNSQINTAGGPGNLTNITPGADSIDDGKVVVIAGANPGSNLVTVVNGAGGLGQIHTAYGDNVPLVAGQYMMLKLTDTDWFEIGRAQQPNGPFPVPTGGVIDFGGQVAPTGFLLCQGQAISRTGYAALFAVIGIAFGPGNGTTTFNIPNMINQFSRGVVNGGSDFPGATQAATTDVQGGHTHQLAGDGDGTFGSSGKYLIANPSTVGVITDGNHQHAVVTPPNVGFNKIIKT